MVLYGGKATKRNIVFKNKTSINTSNVNNINTVPTSTPVVSNKRSRYVTQHNSDWRLRDLVSVGNPLPQSHAQETYDTNIAAADEGIKFTQEGYDPNITTPVKGPIDDPNVDGNFTMPKETGWFGGYFDHLFTPYDDPSHPDNYKEMEAAAQEVNQKNQQDGSLPHVPPPDIVTNFHADGLPIDEMPRSDLQGQGFFHNIITDKKAVATAKEGHELFDIPDYVNNEVRSSYYGLGMNVNPEAHTKAINKQQLRKFENSLQKDWSTLVRNNAVDDVTYLNLQMRIGEANISAAEKERLIGVFQKKKNKLQGTSVSSPKTPNKTEQLKIKIDSGDFTSKEWDQYQTLTGNPVLYYGNKSKVTNADGTFKPKVLTYKDLF